MHSVITSLFVALLFFLFAPGTFMRFPKNGSKMTVTAVHALIVAVLFYFLHNTFYRFVRSMEGLEQAKDAKMKALGAGAVVAPLTK